MCLGPFCGTAAQAKVDKARRVARATSRTSSRHSVQQVACKATTANSQQLELESQFRGELKARGAALQELFWQELDRTRSRLREAGFADGGRVAGLDSALTVE